VDDTGKWFCLVCGYPELRYPPTDWNICPCCGVEFNYHDSGNTYAELRAGWIAGGCAWFSNHTPAPQNWDANSQLERADFYE